jgi:hypothetical protein
MDTNVKSKDTCSTPGCLIVVFIVRLHIAFPSERHSTVGCTATFHNFLILTTTPNSPHCIQSNYMSMFPVIYHCYPAQGSFISSSSSQSLPTIFPQSKYHFQLFSHQSLPPIPSGINSRHFPVSHSFRILLLSSTNTSWQLVLPHNISNELCVMKHERISWSSILLLGKTRLE